MLHSAVWTGQELVVHGGASNLQLQVEGAAYRPKTQRWRRLPQSPLRFASVAAVWTGELMLVLGFTQDAAYDPAERVWTRLPPSPLAPRVEASAVWTGAELIVWGGEGCTDACYRNDGAAYRP